MYIPNKFMNRNKQNFDNNNFIVVNNNKYEFLKKNNILPVSVYENKYTFIKSKIVVELLKKYEGGTM